MGPPPLPRRPSRERANGPGHVSLVDEAVASKHDAISLHSAGKMIAADQPEHSAQLRRMIASAAHCGPGGALCLLNEAGDRVLLVVSPLPALLDDTPGRPLVTVSLETDMLGPLAEMLIALFGLTAAEADLAWSLTQNESLGSIQIRRGVSENTIRTQLAHVFAKTRTANQRELVRLLSVVPRTLVMESRPESTVKEAVPPQA